MPFDFRNSVAAGIGDGQQRSGAGSGQNIHGNILFLEYAQDPQVGDAARETPAQRDSDAHPLLLPRRRRRIGIRELPHAPNRALKPGEDLLCINFVH